MSSVSIRAASATARPSTAARWAAFSTILDPILCRSTGALILMMAGCAAIYLTRRLPRKAWILGLVLILPLFIATRPSGSGSVMATPRNDLKMRS